MKNLRARKRRLWLVLQKHFKHEAPKEPGITEPRINLTFRRIEHK